MTLIQAYSSLQRLGVPAFTTRDAAALLDQSPAHASQTLRRLALEGYLHHLGRGRWGLAGTLQSYALPESLTAPRPSYVSLYSALYHHGLIEQIPDVVYAVTLAETRRVTTPIATVSLSLIHI